MTSLPCLPTYKFPLPPLECALLGMYVSEAFPTSGYAKLGFDMSFETVSGESYGGGEECGGRRRGRRGDSGRSSEVDDAGDRVFETGYTSLKLHHRNKYVYLVSVLIFTSIAETGQTESNVRIFPVQIKSIQPSVLDEAHRSI